MKLHDDFDDNQGLTPTMIMTLVAVVMFIAAIFIVVLFVNSNKSGKPKPIESQVSQESDFSPIIFPTEKPESGSLHPEDLDFWDKYPVEESESVEVVESKEVEVVENDPSTDGKHVLVTAADGSEEWVLISPYLPKHEYDFTRLVCQSDFMKYYENGKQVSFVGIDVSKFQDYIDFVKVKRSGVDYCMIRVGARGYSSGQLIEDEYFAENIKRATDAGLDVGVYFYSQAITADEAIEEANFVIARLAEYKIVYPVAFDMELVTNDSARTDALTKSERTTITKAFLDTVSAAGYQTAIYGDKEWLIKKIDMSKLSGYDVWLSEEADIPDYPYRFSMWQYNTQGTVDGIVGWVDLNISFIDYAEK